MRVSMPVLTIICRWIWNSDVKQVTYWRGCQDLDGFEYANGFKININLDLGL